MDKEKCAAAMRELQDTGLHLASILEESADAKFDSDILPEPCILCNADSHEWSKCPLAFQVPSAGSCGGDKASDNLLAALKAVKFRQQTHKGIVVERHLLQQITVACQA